MTSRCSDIRKTTPASRRVSLRRLLAIVVTPLLAAVAVAQEPSLRIVKGLSPFSSIVTGRGMNVTLVMADEVATLPASVAKKALGGMGRRGAGPSLVGPMCIVRAEPSVSKAVECVVEAGVLSVSAGKFKFRRSPRVDVFVVCDSSLRVVHGTSGGNIKSRGTLRLPSVAVRADFAMEIHLTLISETVSVQAANKSVVGIMGQVGSLHADIAAASAIRMSRISCASVSLAADGESEARVSAEVSLGVSATNHSRVECSVPDFLSPVVESDETSSVIVAGRMR